MEKLSVLKMSLLGWSKLHWPQRGNLRRTDLGRLFVVWDVAARLDEFRCIWNCEAQKLQN